MIHRHRLPATDDPDAPVVFTSWEDDAGTHSHSVTLAGGEEVVTHATDTRGIEPGGMHVHTVHSVSLGHGTTSVPYTMDANGAESVPPGGLSPAALIDAIEAGTITEVDARQVARFSAFLTVLGQRPECTCSARPTPHRHVDPVSLAYAHGEDVDPPGTVNIMEQAAQRRPGWVQPIEYDDDGNVVQGHHRAAALRQLGDNS